MSIHDLREYLSEFAWLRPGIAISVVLSIVLGGRAARALGVSRMVATTLLFGAGLIVAATLTPSREALTQGAVGTGTCEFGRVVPASVAELLSLGDPTFNVLLFVPLGLAIGLFPATRRKPLLVSAAFVLPLGIEAIQLLATGLGRGCQSSDVADNLTGLVIGLAIGVVAGHLTRSEARRRQERSAPES